MGPKMNKKIEYFTSIAAIENKNYILHYNFDKENIINNKIKNLSYYPVFSGSINTGIVSQAEFDNSFNNLSGYIHIDGSKIKSISLPYINTENISGIFAGKNFSVVLQNNKKVISWGEELDEYTDFTELNDFWGQTVSGNNLDNIKDISINSMGLYVLALLNDGKVTGWGKNDYNVATGANNINSAIKVSAGFDHGLALLSDGTITGWGNNNYGQISNLNLITSATGVFAGSGYSLILKQNGTITGFGLDNWGQISDCKNLINVKNISAGTSHAFAILNNKKITGWGNNEYKQVANVFSITSPGGINYTQNQQSKHDLKFLGNWQNSPLSNLINVKKISAGHNNTLALFEDGTITGWGNDLESKTSSFINSKNIKDISAGYLHSLSVNNSHKIYSYGNNDVNQGLGYTNFYRSLAGFDNSRFTFILNYQNTGATEGIIFSTMYSTDDNQIYGFNVVTNAYNNLCIEHYDENQDYILEETNFNLSTKGILAFVGIQDSINVFYLNTATSTFEKTSAPLKLQLPFIKENILIGKSIETALKKNSFEGFIKDFIYININLNENQLNNYCGYFINDFDYYYTTSLLNEKYTYEDIPANSSLFIEPFSQISNNCLDNNFFEKSGENYGYITGYVSGSKNVITGSVLKLYYDVRDTDFTKQIKLSVKTGEDIQLINTTLTEITGERSYTGLQLYDVCNNQNLNMIVKENLLRTYIVQTTGTITDLFEERIVNVTVKSGEPYITGQTILTGAINDAQISENYRFNPIIDIVSDDNENYNNALILFENGILSGYGYNQNGQIFGVTGLNNVNKIWTGDFKNSSLINLKNISGLHTSQNYSSEQKTFFLNSGGYIQTGFGIIDTYGLITGGKNLSGIIKMAIGKDFAFAILNDNSLTGWGYNISGFLNPEKINSIDGKWTGNWSSTYLGSLQFKDIQTVNSGTTLGVLSDGTITGWGLNKNALIYGINDYELGFPFYLKITGIRNDLINFNYNLLFYTGFYNQQPSYTDVLNFNSSLYYSGNNNWILEYQDFDIKILLTGTGELNENSKYMSVPINNSSDYTSEIYISNAIKNNINGKYIWNKNENTYNGGYIIETGIVELDFINKLEFSGLSITELNGIYTRLSGGYNKFKKDQYFPNSIILEDWSNDQNNMIVDDQYILTGNYVSKYGDGTILNNVYIPSEINKKQYNENNLIAFWNFENQNGLNVIPTDYGNYNLNVQQGYSSTGRKNNKGFYFGGSSSGLFINTGFWNLLTNPISFSVSFWWKPYSTGISTIMGNAFGNMGFHFDYYNNYESCLNYESVFNEEGEEIDQICTEYKITSGVVFKMSSGYAKWNEVNSLDDYIQTGQWYHIVGTYDHPSTTAKLYINGILRDTNAGIVIGENSQPQCSGFAINGSVVQNGKEYGSESAFDNLGFWSGALSNSEIELLYNENFEKYISYSNNQWSFISNGEKQWYNITTNSKKLPLTGWEINNSLGQAGIIYPSSNPEIWYNNQYGWIFSKLGEEDGQSDFKSTDLVNWETQAEIFDGSLSYFYPRLTGTNDFIYQGYCGVFNNEDVYYKLEKEDDNWIYYTSNNTNLIQTGIGGDYPWESIWYDLQIFNESIYRTYTIKRDASNGNIWGIFYDQNRYYYNTGSANEILPQTDWISASTDGLDYIPYSYIIRASTSPSIGLTNRFLQNKVYYYSGYSRDYSDNILRPIYTGINSSYLKYIEENSFTGWKISNHTLQAFKMSTSNSEIPETGTFSTLLIEPIYINLKSQSSLNLTKSFVQLEKFYDTKQDGSFSGDYTLTPIGNLTNVQKITLSKNHAICLFSDGTITGWGQNTYNQVANLNPQNYYNNSGQWTGNWSDSNLTKLTGVKDIFVGENCSFALFNNGSISGWGKNIKFDPFFNGVVWSGNWDNSILKNTTGIQKIIGKKENYNIILFNNGTLSGFGISSDINNVTGLNDSKIQNEIYYNYDFSVKNLTDFRSKIEKIENIKFKNENITPLKEYSMSKVTSLGFDRIVELNKQNNYINTFGIEEITINRYLDANDWIEIYNFNLNESYAVSVNKLAYLSNSSNNIFVGEDSVLKFLTFNGVGQLEVVDYDDLNNQFIDPKINTDSKDLIDINQIRTGDFYFNYTGQNFQILPIKDFVYLNGQKLISGYHYNFSSNNINFNTGNILVTGLIYSFNSLLPYARYTGLGEYYYDLNKRFQKYTNIVWLNGLKLPYKDYLETSYNDSFYEPEFKKEPNKSIYFNENSYFNI